MINMPTYSKIPKSEKAKGAIASGQFAVFGDLLSVGSAVKKLQAADMRKAVRLAASSP